jgi:hypothetical protein
MMMIIVWYSILFIYTLWMYITFLRELDEWYEWLGNIGTSIISMILTIALLGLAMVIIAHVLELTTQGTM